MIKIISLSVFLFVFGFCHSQDNIRFGLHATPAISWLKSDADSVNSTGIKAGFSYGLIFDLRITDNYGFATGICIASRGGSLQFLDTNLVFLDSTYRQPEIQYRLQYIGIPITLKFKTNEIGYMKYFMQFGITPSINVKGRGSVSADIDLSETDIRDEIKFFDTSLTLAGGFEYSLGGNTALVVAVIFDNGFADVIKHKDLAKLNVLNLRLGILF